MSPLTPPPAPRSPLTPPTSPPGVSLAAPGGALLASPLVDRLAWLADEPSVRARVALVDAEGARTFEALWVAVEARARSLLAEGLRPGERVLLLGAPSAAWVRDFFAVLRAGGVAVPLSLAFPPVELAYFAADSGASLALVEPGLGAQAEAVSRGRQALGLSPWTTTSGGTLGHAGPAGAPAPVLGSPSLGSPSLPESPAASAPALFLYTSGTTGKPKGAVLSHGAFAHQGALLREAWAITPADVLLHALPLHHLHGLGIALVTTLLSGAAVRLLPRFDALAVWRALAEAGSGAPLAPTTWMAVPTMYQRLFEALDAAPADLRARFSRGAAALRLATSGSAALPVSAAARWRELTGAIPLERFGMTEIGVGCSSPLEPGARRPGTVGPPLPTVEARLVDEHGRALEAGPGELWIRGPSLFSGYFGRDEATREAFEGGFFKTGDVAERAADGFVRLLGRTSVDILKSGGEKISALELEEVLREHPAVGEVAVVGLPDATWGQRVVAAVVPREGCELEGLSTERVRAWARERLVAYKLPREVALVRALPRNTLGKVQKPELARQLANEPSGDEPK
jgi:malonyl-CoA/methylmalonyl-CoA synthetase